MRIADVVHAESDGRTCIVDANATGFDLGRYMPAENDLPITPLAEWDRDGAAMVLTVLDDAEEDDDGIPALRDVVAEVRPGDVVAIFVSASQVPFLGRAIAELTEAGLQIDRLVPLDYTRLTAAVVAAPVPVRPVGLPSDDTGPGTPSDWQLDRAFLRIVNEHAQLSFRHRLLRHELESVQQDLQQTTARLAAAEQSGRQLAHHERHVAALEAERRNAEAQLEEMEEELDRATRRLREVHGSTTWQVGQVITDAARSPRRVLTAPRRLAKLWQQRGHRPDAPPREQSGGTTDGTDSRGAQLMARLHRHVSTSGRTTLGGLIGGEFAEALRSVGVEVIPVLPHDPASVCDGIDVLLIDAAEMAPGGRWFGAGQPGWPRRDEAVARLVDTSVAAAVPIVYVPDWSPPAPGIGMLAPTALHLPRPMRGVRPLQDPRLTTVRSGSRSKEAPLLRRAPANDQPTWHHGPVIELDGGRLDAVALGLRSACVAVQDPSNADVAHVIVPLVASGAVVVTDRHDLDIPGVVVRPDLQPVEGPLDDRRVFDVWRYWHRHHAPSALLTEMMSLIGAAWRRPAAPIGLLAAGDERARSRVVEARQQLDSVVVVGSGSAADEFVDVGLDVRLVAGWDRVSEVLPADARVWLPGDEALEPLLVAAEVTAADVVVGGDELSLALGELESPGAVLARRALLRIDVDGPSLYPVPRFHVPTKEASA